MLQHCKDAHLVLSWEKCHFMVKEGIVLGHKVSGAGLEVDKAKINVISKLSPPTNIKVIEKITLLFEFDDGMSISKSHSNYSKGNSMCPVISKPKNWNLLFELMYDASDFAVGAVLEFDIEIKDKKGTENVAADHLSQIENDKTSDDSEVDDNFPGETLMEINTKDELWKKGTAFLIVCPNNLSSAIDRQSVQIKQRRSKEYCDGQKSAQGT
ncbi:hypothetical protein Tco_1304441 [Tanacetum coccineum]